MCTSSTSCEWSVDVQVGTLMAGTDKFYIRISGMGGHGGTPHVVRDSVVAGSAVVMNLQPLISRETDPTQGGIVGVTLFNSGDQLVCNMLCICCGINATADKTPSTICLIYTRWQNASSS